MKFAWTRVFHLYGPDETAGEPFLPVADVRKLKLHTGWTLRWKLEEGLRRVVERWKSKEGES